MKGAEVVEEGDAGFCLLIRFEVKVSYVEWIVPLVVWVEGMISSLIMIPRTVVTYRT